MHLSYSGFLLLVRSLYFQPISLVVDYNGFLSFKVPTDALYGLRVLVAQLGNFGLNYIDLCALLLERMNQSFILLRQPCVSMLILY
jgi:hypothetical protein